jgi:glycosyltransferase involved in cell wall biosynthesis
MGYVSDTKRIVDIYNASDVFVLPSLSENLPNTIMEAMACGIPCVGFQVGGIPEEIDHQENGYVARYKEAKDLADGINWVLYQCDYTAVSQSAIAKVAHNYSQNAVALKYINVYNEALSPTNKAHD